MITSFKGEYDWLSNFYRRQVTYPLGTGTYTFPSSEHAYQAQKGRTPADFKLVCEAATPGEAKRAGRRIRMTSEQEAVWDMQKKRIMLEIVLAKFRQHEDLRNRLVETDGLLLIEGNTWGDDFWGCVPSERRTMMLGKPFWGPGKEWFGDNYLGQILMAVRMVLR